MSDPVPFVRFEEPSDEAEGILVRWFDARAEGSDESLDDLLRAHPDRADELRARVSALEDLLGELPDARDAALPERLGPFRIGARLGGGGMGVVVAAHDEELGRDVAVKIVRPDLLFLGKARARFRREVEAVARLEHPGIVPVLSVGEDGGLPWFAMERVRGVSLAEVVRALGGRAPESLTGPDLASAVGAEVEGEGNGEVPPAWRGSWVDACLDLARQVAAALHHAHARGVIHRDVKPSNVMVTPDGRARLIDFGLTAAEGSETLTRSGAALGTLLYMAPEQVRGDRDADARADVYGLGATLYELLALQPHVLGNGPAEVARRIVTGEVEPLRARNRAVAADVDTVVRKALDVERGRRYGDAAAFEEDLARLLAREPVAAEPLGPWLRARRWCERRPALAVAVGLGALLVVLLPTALLVQQHRYAGRLERSLADAETAHAQAEEVVRFLLDAFGEVNPERNGGRQPTAMDVLDAAAEKLGAELADRPVDRARLSYSIAKVRHHLGDDRGALPLLDGLVETLEGVEESWVEPLRGAALALRSAVHLNLDRVDEAEADALRANEWAAAAPDELVPPEAGGYLGVLASVRRRQQRPGEELELRRRALAELEHRGAGPAFVSRERVTLVGALLKAGRFEEARSEAEGTLAVLRSAAGARPSDLAVALNALGLAHRKLGGGEEARAAYEEALALQREVFGPDVPATRMTEANLAGLLEMKGEFEAAGRAYLALADWFAAYYRPEHAYAVLLRGNGAGCLFRAGFHAEVVPIYEALIPLQRRAYGDDHAYVAASTGKLGKALFETGRPAEAIPKLRAAADASEATGNFAFAVGCLAEASGAALAIGDETAARTLAARAVALIDAHGVTHPAEEPLRNTAR